MSICEIDLDNYLKQEKTKLSLTQSMIIVFKQSTSLKINNNLSFAGQIFNLQRAGGEGG